MGLTVQNPVLGEMDECTAGYLNLVILITVQI